MSTVLIIFTRYIPAADSSIQEAYVQLLGQNHIFVTGSMIAYYISQTWDVYIFHKIRNRWMKKQGNNKNRWIWNNMSTATSQMLDTVLFIGVSFGIGFGWLYNRSMWPTLASMMIGQYVCKLLLAVLDTPFFYLMTRGGCGRGDSYAEYMK